MPSLTTPNDFVEGSSSYTLKKPELISSTQVGKETPVNMKLNSPGKLTIQQHFRIWSASIPTILKVIKAYKVVVDGMSPAVDADNAEIDTYEHLCHTALTIVIQVVS